MARVPGVPAQRVLPQGGPLNVNPPPDAFGPVGDALAMGGKVAEQLSDTFARHAEAQAAIDNKIAADTQDLRFQQRVVELKNKFISENRGERAEPNLPQAFKDIESIRNEEGAGLLAPAARDLYNSQTRIAAFQATSALASFASQEGFRVRNAKVDANVANVVQQMTPDNFVESAAKVGAFAADKARLNGWPEEVARAYINKELGSAAFNITAGVAATNPEAAQKFYDAQKGFMTPQQRTQAEAYIRQSTNAITNAAIADEWTAKAMGTPESVWNSIIQQESGGQPGVVGPPTPYGRAEGLTQLLPATAKSMAAKLGVPWRPELMRAKTPEAKAYQEKLGRTYFEEGLAKYNGDVSKAAAYYFGGPDEKLWGTRTQQYVAEVLKRAGQAGDLDTLETHAAATLTGIANDPRLKGDPVRINQVTSQFLTNIDQQRKAEALATGVARDRLQTAINAGATSMAQLQQAYPGALEDINSLGGRGQRQLEVAMSAEANQPTPEKTANYEMLKGWWAKGDPRFLRAKLADYPLTTKDYNSLFNLQKSTEHQNAKNNFVQATVTKALANEFVKQGLASAGWEKDTPEYDRFTGALAEELAEWADNNPGKTPDLAKIATPLLAKRTVPARNYFFGIPLNRTTMDVRGLQIPDAEADRIREAYRLEFKREPEEWEIGQLYQRGLNSAGR